MLRLGILCLLLLWPGLGFGQSLTATWQDNSANPCPSNPETNCAEDEFILERCTGDLTTCSAGPFTEVARPPQDATSWVDSNGLSYSTDYTYRVAAINAQGQSGWSNLASAQTTAPPPPPDTLVSLACSQSEQAFLLSDDFESSPIGGNPLDWRDTQVGNSFVEDDSLMAVQMVGGSQAAAITNSGVNIHSHYIGVGSENWANYTFTGRLWISGDSGIGVTFLSQFPQGQDHYYRIRRHSFQPTFQVQPHGTAVSGDIESGVNPTPNTWYRFRIQVQDTGMQTEIRANIWPDGQAEPAGWQINAVDSSPTRLTSGTVGFWSWAVGQNGWDDVRVE